MPSHNLNGVAVANNTPGKTGGNVDSQIRVASISVEYDDGRTFTFVPEAGEDFMGQDEMLMIADRFLRASEIMEWRSANNHPSM